MMTVIKRSPAVLAFAVLALFAATVEAQVCPPTPAGFNGLTGIPQMGQTNNAAILDFFTANDSSDAVNNDNTAEAYQTEPIAIQFGDVRVPAASPMSICFSVGIPSFAQTPPQVDGNIWLDISGGNFFTLVDGLGLTKPFPDLFGVTPGPNNFFTLFAAVTADPGALGACATFQTILIDPLAVAPFFVSFSNPIAFGVAPGIRGISPNVQSSANNVIVDIPGATPGALLSFNPGLFSTLQAGNVAIVPSGALSGQLGGLVNIWNIQNSVDGINDYVVVTNPTPQSQAGGSLTMVANPNFPVAGTTRGSGLSTLPNANSQETWTVSVNAGDIIDIEVLSTDLFGQNINDGNGNLINPFATVGFDPFVTLFIASNPDQLVFDPGTNVGLNLTAPFALHQDDNSGPENNASLRWQAKWGGTYDIVVGCSVPAGFVLGSYVINVVVTPGAPCVQKFNTVGGMVTNPNRRNIVPQGGQIDLICANVTSGNSYTVDFIPKAGAPFTTRSVTGVVAAANNRLTVTIPPTVMGNLPMGVHQVRLRDDTLFRQGLIWDNSVFTPFTGVLPDLLCIRGATTLQGIAANLNAQGLLPIATVNTQSVLFPSVTVNAGSLLNNILSNVIALDPGGSSVMYAEALGVDENINDLFDSVDQFSGTGLNGIFNPTIQSYAYSLLNPGPQNDDDGILPTALFPAPMGIGFSSAIIDRVNPLLNPAGGIYDFVVGELITFGPFANHAMLFNVSIL